jgi:hypothetical protein
VSAERCQRCQTENHAQDQHVRQDPGPSQVAAFCGPSKSHVVCEDSHQHQGILPRESKGCSALSHDDEKSADSQDEAREAQPATPDTNNPSTEEFNNARSKVQDEDSQTEIGDITSDKFESFIIKCVKECIPDILPIMVNNLAQVWIKTISCKFAEVQFDESLQEQFASAVLPAAISAAHVSLHDIDQFIASTIKTPKPIRITSDPALLTNDKTCEDVINQGSYHTRNTASFQYNSTSRDLSVLGNSPNKEAAIREYCGVGEGPLNVHEEKPRPLQYTFLTAADLARAACATERVYFAAWQLKEMYTYMRYTPPSLSPHAPFPSYLNLDTQSDMQDHDWDDYEIMDPQSDEEFMHPNDSGFRASCPHNLTVIGAMSPGRDSSLLCTSVSLHDDH